MAGVGVWWGVDGGWVVVQGCGGWGLRLRVWGLWGVAAGSEVEVLRAEVGGWG